jgi:DNA processing protein
MNTTELFHVLALLKIDGVGDIVAKKLINHCGSAEKIFSARGSLLKSIDGIGEILLKKLKDKSVFEKAAQELKFIENEKIEVLYYKDENYPDKLKHCIDGPVLLFATGNFNFENRKLISIVGTRQITSYGTEFCKKLIEFFNL